MRAREEAEDAAAIAALYSDGEDEDCGQVVVDEATQAEAEVYKQGDEATRYGMGWDGTGVIFHDTIQYGGIEYGVSRDT